MALPKITFIEGQGGLGRPLDSQDHISGLLFYTGTLPSGFTSDARVKALYSVQDAVDSGILKDYSDATAAAATYTFTNVGAAADTIELKVADLDPLTGANRTTSLGAYTRTSGDTTVTLLAASYTALINAGTPTHGYTATSALGVVTITAPKAQGAFLNSGTPVTATIVGTITGTIAQFGASALADGVSSQLAIYHYHISEFFRMQPKGILYVGFYAVPSPYTFSEISLMQTFAEGKIRQIGVYKDAVWASADITSLQAVCEQAKLDYMPLSAVYCANLQATADITTLTDLATLSAPLVSNVIAQDAGGLGKFLYRIHTKTIGCVGNLLGAISARKVSESPAWVEKSNASNGRELETVGFANGQLVSALSTNALEALNTKRHLFLKKFTGVTGSYYNDSHTAVALTSDYAYIENNRTIAKAERILYAAYVPKLSSPVQFNADGTLSDDTVALFESIGNSALDQMVRDSEISAKSVTINPTQNVISTSKLVIAVTLVINGVARTIEIPIGFSTSI